MKKFIQKSIIIGTLVFFSFLFSNHAYAAVNTFKTGGSGNWNSTLSWSLGSIPTASDGNIATFDATSPNCTVNVATASNAIDFTNYTNTITLTFALNVSGNVTLGAGMGIAGTNSLVINAESTMTSNGKTWGLPLVLNSAGITTFADDWTVSNFSEQSGVAGAINGSTVNVSGNFTHSGTIAGTTNFVLNGTGTWSGGGLLKNNVTINTAGTITISGNIRFLDKTLTYTAGTVITTGSTLNIQASVTLNTAGIVWNNILVNNLITPWTITNNSLLTVNGTLTDQVSTLWLGTAGWTVNNFSTTGGVVGSTYTLQAGNTYTVNTSTVATSGTSVSHIKFVSSTTSPAYLNLAYGATQDLSFLDATWIDSTGGQTIRTYKGTIDSNSLNWLLLVPPATMGKSWVN